MYASTLGSCTTTCAIAPAFLARPVASRRTLVCKAAKDSNDTLKKLAGAAAAAQIALFPFAGSALAQPQFDLAADLPNPLALAQDKAKEAIPSNGNAAAQKDPVGDRQALLDKMNSSEGPDEAVRGGASGHPRAETGDLALGDIGDIVGKAKDATGGSKGDSPLTPGEVNLPQPPSLEETKKAVKDVTSGGGGLKEAARSGGRNISASRATGDVSLGDLGGAAEKAKEVASDAAGKAKDASPTPDVSLGGVLSKAAGLASNANGGVDLPGPSAGGNTAFPDLKSAVASRGANISRTGDAMPDGLKPGQYQPS